MVRYVYIIETGFMTPVWNCL